MAKGDGLSPFRVVFLGEPALDSSNVRFLVDRRQLEAVARRWSHMLVSTGSHKQEHVPHSSVRL